MPLEIGFHGFDATVRLIEESVWHPTGLYTLLDQTFGISGIDPFEQLGIYGMIKGMAQSAPLPPAPPPLAGGSQRPAGEKERVRARFFG